MCVINTSQTWLDLENTNAGAASSSLPTTTTSHDQSDPFPATHGAALRKTLRESAQTLLRRATEAVNKKHRPEQRDRDAGRVRNVPSLAMAVEHHAWQVDRCHLALQVKEMNRSSSSSGGEGQNRVNYTGINSQPHPTTLTTAHQLYRCRTDLMHGQVDTVFHVW